MLHDLTFKRSSADHPVDQPLSKAQNPDTATKAPPMRPCRVRAMSVQKTCPNKISTKKNNS